MILYHGTSKFSARRILHQGFRDWSWTVDSFKYRHLAKNGIERIKFGGSFGNGIYVTANWKAALHFGPVLFRVELTSGTKILYLNDPPEVKILDRLKREFGHEIFFKHPIKVMPHNKRLTMDEAIQLARYHQQAKYNCRTNPKTWEFHHDRLMELRSLLIRYGIHGWGESTHLDGIVLFAADHVKAREITLCIPTRKLAEQCNDYERTDPPHHSLNSMIHFMHSASGSSAENTRKWVHESNRCITS